MKNTFTEIELVTGEKVRATLTYCHLLKLKGMNKGVFEHYNAVVMKGAQDEFDNIAVLYAAYMCAQIADGAEGDAMSEEEFMTVLPSDREYIAGLLTALLKPKKAKASAARS